MGGITVWTALETWQSKLICVDAGYPQAKGFPCAPPRCTGTYTSHSHKPWTCLLFVNCGSGGQVAQGVEVQLKAGRGTCC